MFSTNLQIIASKYYTVWYKIVADISLKNLKFLGGYIVKVEYSNVGVYRMVQNLLIVPKNG